jgi:ribonuclease HI
MELTAIAEALEMLKEPCAVTLRTDSILCIHAINAGKMLATSKRRRKYETKGKNMDLVRRIWAQLERHRVDPKWVKGHSGDPDNEKCDEIATQAILSR